MSMTCFSDDPNFARSAEVNKASKVQRSGWNGDEALRWGRAGWEMADRACAIVGLTFQKPYVAIADSAI